MRTILLIMALALAGSSARAHNPLTAKFELNVIPQKGAILNVYLSQHGLHQTLIKHFQEVDFAAISNAEYKQLAVQYIKENMLLKAEEKVLEIGEGGIKLGSHQTDLKFAIENYPLAAKKLEVAIDCFRENENHHSVFWWKTVEGKSKVILSGKNDYRAAFGDMEKRAAYFPNPFDSIINVVLLLLFLSWLTVFLYNQRLSKVSSNENLSSRRTG